MNSDHTQILKLAENNNGVVTSKLIIDDLKWDMYRVENVLNFLIKEGIVWIDSYDLGTNKKLSYFFPSLFKYFKNYNLFSLALFNSYFIQIYDYYCFEK